MEKVRRFFKDEEGISAVEYALIAVGIALAIIASVKLVGDQLNTIFGNIVTALS